MTVQSETIVVGGGPAGSTCAWELVRHGRQCLVLERKAMPRPKLCAGWITPRVLERLEIQPGQYPHGIVPLRAIRAIVGRGHRLAATIGTTQYSIRRIEFDAWLLARAGVEVVQHAVRRIRREKEGYVIDDAFGCRYLVGAGGTNCPVRRNLFPEKRGRLVITREVEYPAKPCEPMCTLWFPFAGAHGYGWYVPKADAVNVGFGLPAAELAGQSLTRLWQRFVGLLQKEGCLEAAPPEPKGHPYFLGHRPRELKRENAYLLGDAAGLATEDLAEGIGPAVESGLLAARDILGLDHYSPDKITRHSLRPLVRMLRRLAAVLP